MTDQAQFPEGATLIFGATGGIGAAVAGEFAAAGSDVAIMWRSKQAEAEVLAKLELAMQGRRADCVVSDMAPNLSGNGATDAARIENLVELAVDFACHHMKPEGALVVKLFHGAAYDPLVRLFRNTFRAVKAVKPKASRDKSSETFLVGIGLKALS